MLTKDELVAIKLGFAEEFKPGADPLGGKWELQVEIGYFEGALFALIDQVVRIVQQDVKAAKEWLCKAVFGKRQVFVTGKDARVHVLTALETLINVA